MLKYLMFFTCLTTFLSADKIGNVEFSLPKGWQEDGSPQKNDVSTTTKYSHGSHSTQYFIAHVNSMKGGPIDDQSLKNAMQATNPGRDIEINVLDRTPNSVVFEWSVNDKARSPLEHGFSRFMTTKSGNVVLMYRTNELDYIDKLRPIWVNVLKGAKES